MSEKSRPTTASTTVSKASKSSNVEKVSTHPAKEKQEDVYRGRRGVIYDGPDGIWHHRVRVDKPMFIGETERSGQITNSVSYLFKAAPNASFPKAKHGRPGETGWEVEKGFPRMVNNL